VVVQVDEGGGHDRHYTPAPLEFAPRGSPLCGPAK